jgi:Ca2+-transporting ATPase
MVWLSLAICGGVFTIGVLRGFGLLPMLKAAISLAIAAVPEGLPTVATTTLALGIRGMRKRHVLVRHLDAVETLGAVQVICLDKTGTLTLNRMSVLALHTGMRGIRVADHLFYSPVGRIDPLANDELLRLVHVGVLCNETEVNRARGGTYVLNGSATESALVQLALNLGVGVEEIRRTYPLIKTEYRAEKRNYMRTIHKAGEDIHFVAVKGSPAEVLDLCKWHVKDGQKHELTDADRTAILNENERMAGEALRVLGFAYELVRGEPEGVAAGLVWVGLVGMADPVRQGVRELIARFHGAGIKTVMITGDQSTTAYAIGRQLGLSGDGSIEILDSSHLERIAPEVMSALAQKAQIFARVSPANKLQIVQGLQQAGQVVAMTGDGVNDGPALKAADIGVAMGNSGTDVARDVADVVLEDDDLQTMIIAVSEGRTIYNNIRKAIHFLMSTNLSEIAVMLTSIGAGMGQPLNPMQLLWINLITDVFPALALAVEPPEPDVLKRPPRDPGEGIIRRSDLKRYGFETFTITAGTMASYGFGVMRYGIGPRANTLAFTTLTAAQLLHAYSCRSDTHGIFVRDKLPPNPYLNVAVGGSLVLQLLTLMVPGLRNLLGTTSINLVDVAVIAGAAALPLFVNDATKAMAVERVEPAMAHIAAVSMVG